MRKKIFNSLEIFAFFFFPRSTEKAAACLKLIFIKNQVSPLFEFPFSKFFPRFVVDNLVIRLNN